MDVEEVGPSPVWLGCERRLSTLDLGQLRQQHEVDMCLE
ncbi:hypothetical protein RvY_17968 [Ramazzottius varieornatus]|uniref:Uncharacterized protein n=1 Tax=Ramazzottius varieornatus TaxID=947166 RepID=A0A1D1W9M7_RAMVA|nr:hypothetical protein RvY_17968 [Ramazzottius varieornatus]